MSVPIPSPRPSPLPQVTSTTVCICGNLMGGGTSPACLVLAEPLFRNQVMNIQNVTHALFERAKVAKQCSAEAEEHILH